MIAPHAGKPRPQALPGSYSRSFPSSRFLAVPRRRFCWLKLKWNGTSWSPAVSGTLQLLSGLWGSSGSDLWAVGDAGTILHWDGASWTAATSGTTANLLGVSGISATSVWAVADTGQAVHWDGSQWRATVSGTSAALRAVWTDVPQQVYVAGDQGVILHRSK